MSGDLAELTWVVRAQVGLGSQVVSAPIQKDSFHCTSLDLPTPSIHS